jgi:hypothetical protein
MLSNDNTALLICQQRYGKPNKKNDSNVFQIQYGRADTWPSGFNEEDYIINAPAMYPRPRVTRLLQQVQMQQQQKSRKRRQAPTPGTPVQYTILHLPANHQVNVQVRVLSKYYAGPASNLLSFHTEEGGTLTR